MRVLEDGVAVVACARCGRDLGAAAVVWAVSGHQVREEGGELRSGEGRRARAEAAD